MKHDKLYVVIGKTGEYSDGYWWLVRAYFDEGMAKAHVERATERAREIFAMQNFGLADQPLSRDDVRLMMGDLDPRIEMTYTGTIYFYEDVDLHAGVQLHSE